jgi:hypothetical protein
MGRTIPGFENDNIPKLGAVDWILLAVASDLERFLQGI